MRRGQAEAYAAAGSGPPAVVTQVEGMAQALFVETGFGADQHGQDPTKAVLRACRNAVEFNSIPCVRSMIPGGYAGMCVRATVGVPEALVRLVDTAQVAASFPLGRVSVRVQAGGASFTSGTRNAGLGDVTDQMLVAVAHVVVGAASWPHGRP